jgi:hypothetical protein
MNREQYKSKRKGQPKRKGKNSGSKRHLVTGAKERNSYASPQLREAYSTRIDWMRNVIPKLKKEVEAS